MIQKLKEKNLYENSMIIFTSDHGQEFYEYGYFGHNSAFSKAQIQTPFLIKFPKQLEIKNIDTKKMTSHNDIVPTILTLLGVKNNTTEYSNGYNLIDTNIKRREIFSVNWNNNAIVTQDYTYIFSNTPDKMFRNEVRTTIDYKKAIDVTIDGKSVLDTMNENKRFLK